MDMLIEFFDAPAGQAVIVVALLATADFALGVFAAFRDNTFSMDAVAAWLRRNLAGRVAPVFGTLLVGHMVGGLSMDDGASSILSPGVLITGIGLTAATAYVLEVIASMRESLTAKPDTRIVPED